MKSLIAHHLASFQAGFLSPVAFRRRRHFLTVVISAAFFVAGLRLAFFVSDDIHGLAFGQVTDGTPPPLESLQIAKDERDRARIVDVNGNILADSLAVSILCQRPGAISNPAEAARLIANIIPEADEAYLAERMGGNRAWLTYEVTPRQRQLIHDSGIEGITYCPDYRRIYPYGDLFSHVVGYTDSGMLGLAGMERRLNEELQTRDAPLQTSLDVVVQQAIAEELDAQIEMFEAIGGVAILMDVHTSEIVSLVSLPTFDPLNISDVNAPEMFNRATKGLYELGSVMKPFTVAAALNEGIVDPNTLVDVTRDLQISGHTIADFTGTPRGMFTVAQVIERSSNIGTARIADALGATRQQAYLRGFGFFRPVDFELGEITAPDLPETWGRTQTMTIGFGHGMSVTPLHLMAAEAALVNGGLYRRPTLLARNGTQAEARRVISPEASAQVRSMLRRVTVFGSGRNAEASGYLVGGKTGTADKSRSGGYAEDARISSFLGAFPIHDPRYVLLVSIDEPKPQEWTYGYATGGWVAAPAFARIVERVAPHLSVQRVAYDPFGFGEAEPIRTAAPSALPTAAAPATASAATPVPTQPAAAGSAAPATWQSIDDLFASDDIIF